jgi:hypothetical protein
MSANLAFVDFQNARATQAGNIEQVDFEDILHKAAMHASGYVHVSNYSQAMFNVNNLLIQDNLKKQTNLVSGPASRFIR